MNSALFRNIKSMTLIAVRVLGMGLLATVFLIGLQLFSGDGIDAVLSQVNFFTYYVDLFIILVFCITIMTSYMTTMLSFSTRKKDYFIGRHTVNIGIIVLLSIINIILYWASDKLKVNDIMLLIAMMTALTGIGTVCATLIWKFGSKGYIAFVVFCGFIGGLVGGFSNDELYKNIFSWKYIGISAICIAAVICIISSVFEYSMIMKKELN